MTDKKQIVINTGYENLKEFAENVKNIIDELVELLFDDSKSNCIVDKCNYSNDISCGSTICIELNKRIWENKIDKLLNSMENNDNLLLLARKNLLIDEIRKETAKIILTDIFNEETCGDLGEFMNIGWIITENEAQEFYKKYGVEVEK